MYHYITVKPYIDKQIDLEEKYYESIAILAVPFSDKLKDYATTEHASLLKLNQLANKLKDDMTVKYNAINYNTAKEIQELARDNLIGGSDKKSLSTTVNITNGLNVKFENLLSIIAGRFINSLPVSTGIIGYSGIFEATETLGDIAERNNKSINQYVQNSISEAMSSALLTEAINAGASEYLPDNEHDDKVRELHKKENTGDIWYSIINPPSSGYPGTQPNCRCFYKAFK